MDNSFIIKLFLNGKDVTEQYSVINAKIYRACNKIDKVNPAKRNVMVVKNEMRLLKQKRNVLQI